MVVVSCHLVVKKLGHDWAATRRTRKWTIVMWFGVWNLLREKIFNFLFFTRHFHLASITSILPTTPTNETTTGARDMDTSQSPGKSFFSIFPFSLTNFIYMSLRATASTMIAPQSGTEGPKWWINRRLCDRSPLYVFLLVFALTY